MKNWPRSEFPNVRYLPLPKLCRPTAYLPDGNLQPAGSSGVTRREGGEIPVNTQNGAVGS